MRRIDGVRSPAVRAVRLDAAKPRDPEPLGPAVDDGFADDRHLSLADARASPADAGPDDARGSAARRQEVRDFRIGAPVLEVLLLRELIKMQMLTVDLVVEEEQQDQHPVMAVEAVQVLSSSHIPPDK